MITFILMIVAFIAGGYCYKTYADRVLAEVIVAKNYAETELQKVKNDLARAKAVI